MNTKKLIKEFNKPDTHLVISRWPKAGAIYDGVATYTQDIVTRFAKKYGDKFVILAEKIDNQIIEQVNDHVLVIRAFDERRFHLYPQVLRWLKAFSQVKKVYIHSEFCASGGPIVRFLVVPFVGLIRLFGKEITFYAHNVVKNLDGFERHLGEDSWKLKLFGFGYRWYFRLLSLLVSRFVVLEPSIKGRLRGLVGNKPILVEPHWIAPVKTRLTKEQARRKLGISLSKRVVVSFGFVTHYKGADFVADFATKLSKQEKTKRTMMVLAGGEAYSLKDKAYYQRYYQKIKTAANTCAQLRLTGFLSEKEVSLWLTAADVVVLPYRNLMGGSGALQQALSYGKPVLFSKAVAKGLGIDQDQLTFAHTYSSLNTLLNRFFEDKTFANQVQRFSTVYAGQLSVKTMLPKHYQEVYAGNSEKEMVEHHEALVFQPVQV